MAKHITVLIAEDHHVVREGLKILISSDPEMEIAGEADNGRTAVSLAKALQPDVILMDLAMPKANGLEATRCIRQEAPGCKVLVLSAYQDEDTIRRVLDAGVSGYITKHSAADELLTAIREVEQGNFYYSPAIASRMRTQRRISFETGKSTTPKLTPREQEVLGLIVQGQPNKEIAFTLGLSIKTVEKHRQAIMDKLDIHDVANLTRYALAKALVPCPAEPEPALALV
ncbi:MAG TPA: response regulator transcription factor [Candidatus Sulfotelmatobacter sp.]|nr:response regulator transcription factor [Candidatus Sulfotelmatobacter sp.]